MRVAGQAFTRSGSLYTIGIASAVPFSLLALAITTRYLGPSDYGRLAILFAFASILTIFSGMAVIQGVLRVVYRAADEEDGDADGDGVDEEAVAPLDFDQQQIQLSATEKRRLLGSGILLIVVSSTLWCGPVALLAPVVADVFLGSESWTGAVLLMTVSAWTGSIWRLVHQVWRVERHPMIWSLFQALRPLLVVGGILAALEAGLGIEGVLLATAVGTAVATLISMGFSWRWFAFRPRRGDAPRIIKAGMSVVPTVIARVVQSNVSILVLALIAPAASVGLFYAASRIALLPTYFTSGLLTGWAPLKRSPIGTAALQLRGRAHFSARLYTLLVLTLVGLIVALGLTAGVAIRIAAPSFGDAADIIPIIAFGAGAYEAFHAYYRMSSFPHRRWWYIALLFIWLVPYALALWAGRSLNPTYAVAASQFVASGVVLACIVWLDRRGPKTLPVPWMRVISVAAVGAVCVAAVRIGGGSWTARVVLGMVAILAFPLVLRAVGVLSSADTATARSILTTVLDKPMTRRSLREHLGRLRADERRALQMVAWRRLEPEAAATTLGLSVDLLGARIVRGLRSFTGSDVRPTPADALIARYLLSTAGTVERDMIASALAKLGVSLVELHELDEAMRRFRRARRRGLRLLNAERRAEREASGLFSGQPRATRQPSR